MSCVNKASLQFKDCCKRLDLSEQQLEQIVYDYTNQLGNENTFPTDTYIEQLLRGIPTSELSDSQRELYKLKYKEVQPLDTFELAQQRVLELQQYYPDDRIKIIQRNNGKYQVVVNTDYSQIETELEIQQIKKEAIADSTFMKAPNGNPTNLTERQWLQVRTKAFKDWFGDWINDPANASKVVDKNGEPLVVYHGSKDIFTIFDISKQKYKQSLSYKAGDKHFFTSEKTVAQFFARDPEVLLLERISREIDELEESGNHGESGDAGWNEIGNNIGMPGAELKKIWFDAIDSGKVVYGDVMFKGNVEDRFYQVFLNIKTPLIIDAKGERVDKILEENEDVIKSSESVIIKNVNETVGNNIGDDYLVSNPNQIKSATDNVGTFSRENNSILASRRNKVTRQGIQDIKDIFGESLFGLNDGISLDQAISALLNNTQLIPLTNMLKFLRKNTNIEVTIKHQDRVFNEEGIEVDGLFKGNTNTIILSENSSKPIGQVLTHEILHSLFIDRLNKNPRIRKKLLIIIDNAKYALGEEANTIYGLTGTDEFISELFTDGRLIKALYNIKGDLRTPTNNIISAIYNWVKDCLKLIFKGHPTLYDNALHEVERLFSDENEYSEQGFIKAQNEVKTLLSTIRTPDYKYAEEQLLAIIADYPQLFSNINPKDFLKEEKYSGNYKVIYENGNRHLFVNRNIANVKLKQLRSREYSLVIGEKGAKSIDTLEEVTTRIDALHTAIEMEKSKKSPLIIKAATGWERGADGKWRYEIEDLQLLDSISLKLSNYTILDYQYHDYEEDQFYSKEDFKDMLSKGYEPGPWTKREYIPQTFKITDIVKQNKAFNELTKIYPILKDLNIIISSYNGSGLVAITSGVAIGNYNSLTNTLTVNQDRDPKHFLSTLIHEIQHFIQNEEGFAYGANVSQFKNHPDVIKQKKVRDKALKKLKEAFEKRETGKITQDEYFDIYDKLQEAEEKLNNLPYELYKKVAGEVEARTAERRRELSIEEKRASLFTEDMYKDVAKEDLIFLQLLAEESLSLNTESTKQTEEFYTKQSVDEYINDLVAIDNIKREDIKVTYYPETEDTDKYWVVSYTPQLPTEQAISQLPTLELQQQLKEQKQEPTYEERQLAISEQVSNLINNDRGLKATELRQLSELMVYWMSEFISDCLDNPEKIFQILGITDYSNSDIEKVTLMSRKQIVQMIGVENMFNLCKSYILTPDIDGTGKGNANINSRALRRQAELLKNNFQGLMQFSTSVWSTLEDFSIGLTETGYNTLETSNPDAFLDEELVKERDKQADGESTLESWQVESNTIDALTTATQLVKRELLHCYLYENTGEVDDLGKPIKRIKTNKFGINERLNPREAINAIIKWVLGCWDLNSMVAALKEHQDKNPWVEQLVNKLSDISGNESDFQSQFFSCMCRSFQLYGVVNENDKRELYQHSINKNPMLLMAFNGIKDLYKVGEHPLLKLDGIDRKAFKEFYEDIEQLINFSKKKYSEIENIDELNTLISHVYMLLGYYDATPEVVGAAMSDMTFKTLVQNLLTLRTYLDNEKLNKLYNPFDFKANNSIISTLLNVLKPITYIMDDYAVTQFFESGNMRQSNVIPSFMTKLFSKMQLPLKEFEEFVEKEYGQFDWFYDKKLKKYKNEWLSRLVRMPEEERKKLFEHKVQLSFNKKQYMRGMTDSEYAVSVISEYFTAGKQTAWYKVPIMSNKPTSEFIKFIKYDDSDYKDRIVAGMQHIFVLELGRIQTIIKRQNAGINKSDPRFIKNFDKNGAKFCFLDFLNPFLNESKNTELGLLLNIKINGTRELSTEENARLNDLVKQLIRNSMEARVQLIMESWRQQGILAAVSLIQGFERKPEKAEGNWESAANNAKIENFIWNDTFAAMEILLLTITDVAQYKDAEDLQKRLAQIHAPGVRGNILAKDYFGNQVSDGTHRAVYLTDFDDFISNVIDNVTKVFDKKIAEAPENEKSQWRALKESLVGENGAYRQINVADALAYACPTSYRKKAYMFGKWSREKERMYQQLMSGQYDFSTLKQAFGEPLKPFLYSYEEVGAGVENSPIETFKIGVQNKDSEYLLIMADALTRNEDTGIPNILRAIYDVMEESHKVKTDENGRYIAATDGIDDIQFESTVKAGLYGRINLKQFSTDPQGETNAKNELRSKIFDGLGGYNSTYIHETRYEDYCIQQEVPEHFKDHSLAHGSQIRYIIPSDLPLTDVNGETVVYSYFDPATGTERKLDAKQIKAEYENHCATNIQESLDLLKEEFGLVTPDGQISFDRKQMNQTLSEILKREILSSPRYGIDMLLACSLNADGEFNIPLGDPIQSRRIEQLINSIIKNRINKQKIAGGPVVQVTTFGTSRDLNIRFKSNKGGLLMTRKEFEKSKESGTYEEYTEKYQDGIAYYEIYAPMYTNELFQLFADRDGNIDIKRIEKENPELLKIIGYRIPTEDKYSCFPAKIVGFLPREAGDAVMLPADITAITGSDFDVDKMYLMRKEFKEEKKSKEEITKELEDKVLIGLTGKAKDVTQKQIEDFMNLREGEKESAIKNNISNPIVKAYANMSKKKFVEYTEGRQYHNNMIIDMSYSVLTNKEIAYQVLNPGGFDLLKRMGYAIAAYKDPEVRSKHTFEQLMEMPIEGDGITLKSLCYKNKNLAFFDTQVQFYKQNSAAGMILGMFAVLKIAHAVLESDGFGIDLGKVFIDKNTNEQIPFGFCGIPFLGIVEVDKRFDANNQLIGKTLGSLVASAADAVKDPVLNLNNINNQTANVLTTMLRLGIVYEDAALLLSLPAITKVLLEHSKKMVNKEFISLNALIKSRMLELDDKYYMSESEKIQSEPLNREDLIRGFSENDVVEAEKLEWKVLNAYLKFNQMSLIIKGLTNATRYNSVSNAVGPLIIDNLIMEYKAGKFSDAITYKGVESKNINSVFSIHPILDKFSLATIIARRLLGEMPAYSSDFRILVNNSGDYTLSKIMGDRKLFSKLSDFYQSYLLVQSGFINPKDREYYTDKFPVEFMKYKEQYSDNPFVLAIRLSTGTFGGKTKGILTLDSVGMEQMLKDKLSSGWADLYKENPELAKKLFIYNFFKGGLGFSPKTFMNLVPISMKESIENNGIKYVDVYRHLPSLGNYSMVFDLFVGNNVGDFKLVPQRNPYSEHQNILGNRIIITTKFENYELDYFKIKGFNNIYRIFKLLLVDPITKRKIFVEIPVLGNQGEFFDVSSTPINKSNVTNPNTLEEEGFEPLDEEIMSEEGYDPYYTKIAIDIIKNEKGLKDTKEAYEILKSSRKTQEGLSEQEAEQRKAKIREAVMNSLKRRNITFNEEELNKTTNEFC